MASIATWLAGLVSSLIPFIASLVGKKFAMAATYIVAYLAINLAMITSIMATVSGLSLTMPAVLNNALAMFPENTVGCIGTILATKLTVAAYDAHMTLLKIKIQS